MTEDVYCLVIDTVPVAVDPDVKVTVYVPLNVVPEIVPV